MSAALESILVALEPLIAVDTQNPPRDIDANGDLVRVVREALPDFEISVRDLDEGRLIIDAKRGSTPIVFNVHMDTVPAAPGWSTDPHTLTRVSDRAFGLGTCDTTGAAAVLIALAQATDLPFHLILTTDEEAGTSHCIRTLLADGFKADLAVVAEPTDATARLEHRGLVSAKAAFVGESAHASEARRPSAVHSAAQFIASALTDDAAEHNRLNFGRIEGGVKANMVAAEAEVLFGFRAAPGTDHRSFLDSVTAKAGGGTVTERFVGPALPSDDDGLAANAQREAKAWVERLGIPLGAPVDFWTEASLFAAAGIPTMVLGAGSITQAHNVDEFVTYDQLTTLYDLYHKIASYHG
ncbi:MAG: acetylornithine deacetylase [Pseudomonadota bacterium]